MEICQYPRSLSQYTAPTVGNVVVTVGDEKENTIKRSAKSYLNSYKRNAIKPICEFDVNMCGVKLLLLCFFPSHLVVAIIDENDDLPNNLYAT